MARGHSFFAAFSVCLLVGLQTLPGLAQQSDFTNGVKLYQDGDYQGAATALEAATAADANLEAAWYYLGVSRFRLADYPGSLAALQKALELAPNRPGTRLLVGEIYESQNAYSEAIRVYQDELRYRHGKDILPVMAALGRSLYFAGRPNDAIAQLRKVNAEDPHYVEALYYTGLAYAAIGNQTQALKTYGQAAEVLDEYWLLSRRLIRLRSWRTC